MRKSALCWLWLSLIMIGLDQFSKYYVVNHFLFDQPSTLLPFLNITLTYNTGASFSFLNNANGWQIYLFSIIAIVITLILIYWLSRIGRSAYGLGLSISLMIGGALGNLIDRLRLGYVIDFIDFHIHTWHFAIFNIADSAVSVGATLLLLNLLFARKKERL